MKVLEYDVYDGFNKNGSSRQSEVTATYDELKELFGTPSYTDADPYAKVSCEWVLNVKVLDEDDPYVESADDYQYEQVSVYAWKYGYIPVEETTWNIGGFDYNAGDIVKTIIEKKIPFAYSEVE